MASFSISSYTDTSVTIRVTGITSGQTIRFYIRTDPSDGNDIDKSYTSTSTSISKTFSGLEPDTYYVCNVKVDSDAWLGAKGFTTDPEQPDIDLWSWTSSNGSATST